MRMTHMRAGWLAVALLSIGLASCLTSDPPKLDPKDLVRVPELVGDYVAAAFPPQNSDSDRVTEATVEAENNGSYALTFIESDHKDTPTRMRLLNFKPGTYLSIFTESDDGPAMYALVTRDPDGTWIFKLIDLKRDRRDSRLAPAVKPHGVVKVTLEENAWDAPNDHLHGTLSATQLRALFMDPAVTRAMQTDSGFVLTRK